MKGWVNKLFIEHADLFLKLLNQRWLSTQELVDGISKLLNSHGISSVIYLTSATETAK